MTPTAAETKAEERPDAALRGKVAVLMPSPETVIEDVGKVMRLAGYQEALPQGTDTLLKINISWQHYYPGCSTTPWQFDGICRAMKADGYPGERARDVIGGHRLNQHCRQSNHIAVGRLVGDSVYELKELRRADDRVWDRGVPDQSLLGELGAEVAALGQSVGADDGQRDVMSHTRGLLRGDEVAG